MPRLKVFTIILSALLVYLPLPVNAHGIQTQIGQTQIIVPEQSWATCPKGSIVKFANGDLQVFARAYVKRSADKGLNWVDGATSFSSYTYPYKPSGAINFYGAVTLQAGRYLTVMLTTENDGITQKVIPSEVFLSGQWTGIIAASHSQIVELPDGRLLTAMYGTMSGNTKMRAFALVSDDWGKSWTCLSTIAYSETLTGPGFNESDLLLLPNGKILCFVRAETDSSPALYLCESTDAGLTWTAPVKIFDKGASPHSVLMSNGVIAVATGRPGNWLLFSRDNGVTWADAVQYYTGPNPPDCMNYTSVVEVEPGKLLAVYSRTNATDNTLSEVAGTFITVTKNTIAADVDLHKDGQINWLDVAKVSEKWLVSN